MMTDSLKNNKDLIAVTDSVSDVAGYIWQRGWAEKNAGNISVSLKNVVDLAASECSSLPHADLPAAYKNLAGICFLVTGTGKRMRDIAREPSKNILIIRIDEAGSGYHIVSPAAGDLPDSLRPTSELSSHLSIHSMNEAHQTGHRVVIHTHVNEFCALTQSSDFCDERRLNHLIWSMHPEAKIFIPAGVGFVPYHLPGSEALATATAEALKKHDVAVWEKHGVFATGDTPDDTFDLIDIIAKSASVFFMSRSAGIVPDGLTDTQIDELGKLKF